MSAPSGLTIFSILNILKTVNHSFLNVLVLQLQYLDHLYICFYCFSVSFWSFGAVGMLDNF